MQYAEERRQLKAVIRQNKQLLKKARGALSRAENPQTKVVEVMKNQDIYEEFLREHARVVALINRFNKEVGERYYETVVTPEFVYHHDMFYNPGTDINEGDISHHRIMPPSPYEFCRSKGLLSEMPPAVWAASYSQHWDSRTAYGVSRKNTKPAIRAAKRRLGEINRKQWAQAFLERHSPLCDDLSRMVCEKWL